MSYSPKYLKSERYLRWFTLVIVDDRRPRNVLVLSGADRPFTLPLYQARDSEAHEQCLKRMEKDGQTPWTGSQVVFRGQWYYIRKHQLPDGSIQSLRAYLAKFVKTPAVLPEGCAWFPIAKIRSSQSERLFTPLAYDTLEHAIIKPGH